MQATSKELPANLHACVQCGLGLKPEPEIKHLREEVHYFGQGKGRPIKTGALTLRGGEGVNGGGGVCFNLGDKITPFSRNCCC